MAIGWLTVLKLVPWGDVIENAPKVAQGAKKLWNTVGKKSLPEHTPSNSAVAPDQETLTSQKVAWAALATQVAELQVTTAELHQQMVDSSALIQSLADQNTQLIARLELNRKRWLALVALTLVLGAVVVIKLF